MYQDNDSEYQFQSDFYLTNDFTESQKYPTNSTYYSRPNTSRVTRDPSFSTPNSDDTNFKPGLTYVKSATWKPSSSTSAVSSSNTNICPVLIDEILIPRLRSILTLGLLSFAFPWTWNKSEFQIEKFSPGLEKIWKVIWTLISIQTAFITLFQVYSFTTRMHVDSDGSYRPIFMSSFGALWYTYAITLDIFMLIYRDKIRRYINTLLTINKKYVGKWWTNQNQLFFKKSIENSLVMPFRKIFDWHGKFLSNRKSVSECFRANKYHPNIHIDMSISRDAISALVPVQLCLCQGSALVFFGSRSSAGQLHDSCWLAI